MIDEPSRSGGERGGEPSFTDQMTWEQRTKGVGLVLNCAKIWNVPEALSGKGTGLETSLELLKDIRKPGRCSQRDTVVL